MITDKLETFDVTIDHPAKSLGELQGEVDRRELTSTGHFVMSLSDRPNLGKETVVEFLESRWEDAIVFDYKGEGSFGHRYNIVFDKSAQYYLLTAVEVKDKKVDIITAFKTNMNNGPAEELVKRYG